MGFIIDDNDEDGYGEVDGCDDGRRRELTVKMS